MIDEAMMRRTADELADYLASDGQGSKWVNFTDLVEWESLYNPRVERNFVGKLARCLVSREMAQTRRASCGMQLRLTLAGIDSATEREREVASAVSNVNWAAICGS